MTARDRANKHLIVNELTGGRTESLKDITPDETQALIKHLERNNPPKPNPADKMRKKILSIAYQMDWTIKVNDAKGYKGMSYRADLGRINRWCIERSYLKKPLNSYTYKELPKLISQFEIVYKDYLKSV